jgi:hypothetical protein
VLCALYMWVDRAARFPFGFFLVWGAPFALCPPWGLLRSWVFFVLRSSGSEPRGPGLVLALQLLLLDLETGHCVLMF